MTNQKNENDKKERRTTGTLGTTGKVEVGKSGNRRTVRGLEKTVGAVGADETKIVIPSEEKRRAPGEETKTSVGKMGVKKTDMINSEPKRFDWKSDDKRKSDEDGEFDFGKEKRGRGRTEKQEWERRGKQGWERKDGDKKKTK